MNSLAYSLTLNFSVMTNKYFPCLMTLDTNLNYKACDHSVCGLWFLMEIVFVYYKPFVTL